MGGMQINFFEQLWLPRKELKTSLAIAPVRWRLDFLVVRPVFPTPGSQFRDSERFTAPTKPRACARTVGKIRGGTFSRPGNSFSSVIRSQRRAPRENAP